MRGWRGTERSRHIPFAPFTGRRWRQPDEGPISPTSWRDIMHLVHIFNRTAVGHDQGITSPPR
ncbi:hypothetical protein GFM44_27010 [Rhizobium leguminosarum bv. viciae]|nr:hypothetical protein [Rhizobium leguminosarum bv. viciae]